MKSNTIAALAVCLTACSTPIVPQVPLPGTAPTTPEPLVRSVVSAGAFDLVSEIPVTTVGTVTGRTEVVQVDDFHNAAGGAWSPSAMPSSPGHGATPLAIAEWVVVVIATDQASSSLLDGYVNASLENELVLALSSQSSAAGSATVVASAIVTAGNSARASVTIDLDHDGRADVRRLRFDLTLLESPSGWQVVDIQIGSR